MATKSYSKHKEFKEFSSSGRGAVSNPDEQFDMLKSELIPKGSKLEGIANNNGVGTREYHYEYKEEKHPTGKYDRKDLHTVQEYTVPPKNTPKNHKSESSSYYYEKEERDLPAINRTYNYETKYDGKYDSKYENKIDTKYENKYDSKYDSKYERSASPGYSKIQTSKATKEIHQNVDELDSLLDDLQKDQERRLNKSGYTSDTAESTSFDYRKGTPVKAPSSGYSTLKREERMENSSWTSSPPPPVTRNTEIRQELYREEKHGEKWIAPPPVTRAAEVRQEFHREEKRGESSWSSPPPVTRNAEVRQEMYREEKHEKRVIPSQISPAIPQAVPPTLCSHCHHSTSTTSNTVNTLTRNTAAPMNKVTTTVKTYTYEVPADQDPTTVPLPPLSDTQRTYVTHSDNLRATTTSSGVPPSPALGCQYCSHCNTRIHESRYISTTDDHTTERVVYPPITETKLHPVNEPNGHGPYGPTTYKYFETSYSAHDSTERIPLDAPAFPRPATPQPRPQETPKKLDDLLADFPEARFPTQPDGITHRKVEIMHERSARSTDQSTVAKPVPPPTKNIAGPPVYYPPNHQPLKESAGYTASAEASGGKYASGKGMYEYEAGSKMKEKHTEKKTAVPVCLPLCCAMPCVIM